MPLTAATDHRVAIVTGPTAGIGRAIAAALVDDGWRVYALARSADRLAATGLPFAGTAIVDLRDTAAAVAAFASLDLGAFDRAVLVNNAGAIEPIGPLWQVDAQALADTLALDASTPLALAGAFYRRLLARPDTVGAVVAIGSGAASRAIAGWTAYCAGKAALHHGMRVLAAEVDPARCCVSVLSPGIVDTAMQAEIRAQSASAMPDVGYFRDLHARGQLRTPQLPARWLLARLRAWDLPHGEVVDLIDAPEAG